MIWLLVWLGVKHFIVDFPLQAFPYQHQNKGTYGHLGGLLHSGLHLIGTLLVLIWFTTPAMALGLAALDGVLHYHIDWAKVQVTRRTGWGPTTHEQFWILLGFDQLLHYLTYVLLIWLVRSP